MGWILLLSISTLTMVLILLASESHLHVEALVIGRSENSGRGVLLSSASYQSTVGALFSIFSSNLGPPSLEDFTTAETPTGISHS